MNNSDLHILKTAIKSVENKVFRDFREIENLQSSNSIIKFSNMTIEKLKEDFFQFFTEKRRNYNLIIKDGKEAKNEKNENTIYVNCLSGLRNFVHGIPYFATAISITENKKNLLTAALINNYATQEMFHAERSVGSFLNTKRIRVSNKNTLNTSMVSIKCDNSKEQFIKILNKLNVSFKINNCSILDLCNVASGKLDGGIIFEGSKKELEIGKLIIVEAGGLFEYLNEEKTSCFFSNSIIHNKVKEILA